MQNRNIQIVRLGPMRVASIHTFGLSPEKEAWRNLAARADLKDLLKNRNEHPVFGFNNSLPSTSNPKYGYEIWIKIDPEFEPEGPVRVIDFPGGPYAVTRCMTEGIDYQGKIHNWNDLQDWCKNKHINPGYHQALEKFIDVGIELGGPVLDLYYPIIY